MLNKCLLDNVGATPLVKININTFPRLNVFAKLEFYNPTGSIKDRAANYILGTLLERGEINQDTVIIESTSGNFGIALAAYCKKFNLRFIAVVDPHITPINEMLIRSYEGEIVKVDTPDSSGGYLKSRIKKVNEIMSTLDNSYWINQYSNPLNSDAYYHTIGKEICDLNKHFDYLFVGVSSGGTITGVSQKVKEYLPGIKIIAVDIDGSVIFGGRSKKRVIPGIGSSICPENLRSAMIDDYILIDEKSTIQECRTLLNTTCIFAGGSSGSVIAAIKKYFVNDRAKEELNILTLFPDKGERYIDTIYNEAWCHKHFA